MIYYFFYELLYNHLKGQESILVKALNVFQYVTFRTAYASITALLISLLFGNRVIRALKTWNVGQQIREEGPQGHMAKRGTPTTGGGTRLGMGPWGASSRICAPPFQITRACSRHDLKVAGSRLAVRVSERGEQMW